MREGVVDANGNITVDGRVVATNAITVQSKAGTRQPQPQRSYKTSNGYTYYQYTTGQSFVDGPKSYNLYILSIIIYKNVYVFSMTDLRATISTHGLIITAHLSLV